MAGRRAARGGGCVRDRILVPQTVVVEEELERGDGSVETEERERCVGFYAAPVFRVEDTVGEPLPDPDYAPPELPPPDVEPEVLVEAMHSRLGAIFPSSFVC